ncbi:MAG: HAMP domain-containing sensor histidine kinase [Campylobacterales bacterium]
MATFEKIKELLLSVPLHRTLMFFVTVTVSAFFIGSSSYLKNTVGGIIAESESYHSEMLFSEVIAPKVAMWEFLSGNDAAVLKEQLIDIMHNQKLSAISFTSTDGKTTVTATMPDYRPEASYMIRQLALLFYLEFLLLQNLLMPLRKIAEAVKTYRPGVPLDLHRFLRSKDDEIYEIAKGFEEMQQNIDEAMHAREEELKRSKAKDALIMRQSRFIEMGTMIQNIAHQWKQPLNIIELALTDLTVRQMTGNLSNEQQQNVYDEIHRQVEYMSRTIDTFKHFLEEDRDDEDSLPFSIKETVDTALILTGSTFKKENITLDTDVDEACCAKGNPKEFEQALLSLIHNAVDAIRMHRTAHNAITIRGAVEDDQNIITIEDTGGGFPPELAETMFDAYVTTKHMAQGTGLGLFITKTIFVMKMHGCIEAENSSEGARFTIRIPIDDACRHKAGERLISLSV